jgi:hypothetical protein
MDLIDAIAMKNPNGETAMLSDGPLVATPWVSTQLRSNKDGRSYSAYHHTLTEIKVSKRGTVTLLHEGRENEMPGKVTLSREAIIAIINALMINKREEGY